jgi:hypothetical protein
MDSLSDTGKDEKVGACGVHLLPMAPFAEKTQKISCGCEEGTFIPQHTQRGPTKTSTLFAFEPGSFTSAAS